MAMRRRRGRAQEQLEQSRQFKQGMQADRQRHEVGLEKKRQGGQTHRAGMTTQAQRDVANLQGEHGMARQDLSGQQGMELQGLVGQQREGEQTRKLGFQRDESVLDRQHGMAKQDLANTGAYSRAALGVAGNVLQAGGTGAGGIAATTDPRFMPQALDSSKVPQPTTPQKPTLLDQPGRMVDGVPIDGGQIPTMFDPETGVMRRLPIQESIQDMSDDELQKLLQGLR